MKRLPAPLALVALVGALVAASVASAPGIVHGEAAVSVAEAAAVQPREDDLTAPVTVAKPAKAWRHRDVTVTLTATDDLSGVATTSYKLDDGAWTTGASLVIRARADHANDGPHVVSFYSTDVAGNVEVVKTARVGIDTRRPRTKAFYPVSVATGKTATIDYRVNDHRPNGGKAYVTILIKKMNGTVARRVVVGWVTVNRDHVAKFPATVKKMIYHYQVKARDAAGNRQSVTGWGLFLVW
jgi:hypothetical protein